MITYTRARISLVVGAFAVALAFVAFTCASASAVPRRLEREATVTQVAEYAGAPEARDVVVDSPARFAFVLEGNGATAKVRVLDISGANLTNVTAIGGFRSPSVMAVDEKVHRLFVVDAGPTNRVVIVDVDPASPRAYTVIGSVETAGAGDAHIDVDDEAHVAYVTHATTKSLSIVDGVTHPIREVALTNHPMDVTVDSANHRAYVGMADSTIAVVSVTEVRTIAVNHLPARLQMMEGRLLAFVLGASGGYRLETFEPNTLASIELSGSLPQPTSLEFDEARHLILATFSTFSGPGVEAFSSGSLAPVHLESNGNTVAGALDSLSHDLITLSYAGSSLRVVRSAVRTTPPPDVNRIGGADRFAVSASVSAESFEPGVPVAYVASGEGFADALSGSAAAGVVGGPVLLVSRDSVPDSISAELSRLKPTRIVVLGGAASVSAAVETRLAMYSGSVSRIAGADRFEVSARVSADAFSAGARVAYVASGEVFPDALSGSAAAGQRGAPVLLVQKRGVPASVDAELRRLRPDRIVVLGGEATIDASVAAALSGIAPVTRIAGADRFAVSANVSAGSVPRGVDTVYVASGAVFPDALSGSAGAVADRAPVLLVTADVIPAAVEAELRRLAPYRIVVLGGPNTVSEQVVQQLRAYLPS
jgi:putative cell wall-binding protein